MHDPLGYGVQLPHERLVYPLGFPMRIASNDPSVIEAAEESWCGFGPWRDAPVIEVRIGVTDQDSGVPSPPAFHAQGHLLSIVSDAFHHAAVDLERGFAFCWITRAALADRAWLRYFFLEAIAYVILTHRHFTPVHAACVARNGCGVLLCGASGAGKSTLAWACARRGWTYLTDDASMILRRSPEHVLVGKPHQIRFRENAVEILPELAGLPAIRSPSGKVTIEVRTRDVPGLVLGRECKAGAVVFLHRTISGPARLAPISSDDAYLRLEDSLQLWAPSVRKEQEADLRDLAGGGVFELTYSGLDSAVAELERL